MPNILLQNRIPWRFPKRELCQAWLKGKLTLKIDHALKKLALNTRGPWNNLQYEKLWKGVTDKPQQT